MAATDYKMLAYYSLGAIAFSIAGMYYTLSTIGDKDYPDEISCKKSKDYVDNLTVDTAADGMGCHIWDGSNCRKGVMDKLMCVSKGSKLMQFFLLLFVASIIAAIVFYLKSGKKSDMSDMSDMSSSSEAAPMPAVIGQRDGEGGPKFRPFRFDRYRY